MQSTMGEERIPIMETVCQTMLSVGTGMAMAPTLFPVGFFPPQHFSMHH